MIMHVSFINCAHTRGLFTCDVDSRGRYAGVDVYIGFIIGLAGVFVVFSSPSALSGFGPLLTSLY